MDKRIQKMQRVTALLEERYRDELRHNVEKPNPFKTLIGCVLSQRTRDENAEKAAEALFTVAEEPKDILKLGKNRLSRLIRRSGFYNQKARYIRGICESLVKEFDGCVPNDRERLLRLPGVGPKTADIVLSYAFNAPAIAVDVHVETVAKRLGLVEDDADPREVKRVLEVLVPTEDRRLVDGAFVRFGKEFCSSRAPRCGQCFLKHLCDHPRSERVHVP